MEVCRGTGANQDTRRKLYAPQRKTPVKLQTNNLTACKRVYTLDCKTNQSALSHELKTTLWPIWDVQMRLTAAKPAGLLEHSPAIDLHFLSISIG